MPDYELAARRAARKYGLNERIFVAQLKQESGLKPGQTSSANAQGIAQFIPSTAAAYGVNLHDNKVSDDLDGAARYMRDNLKKYGSYSRALSAYNSGRPDAYKDPGFARGQTYNYVKNILAAAGQGDPSGKGVKSGGGGRGPTSSTPTTDSGTTTTRTTTTPGVDRQHERAVSFINYLERGGQGGILGLHADLQALADTPSTSRTVTTRTGGRSSGSTSGSTSDRGGSAGGTSLSGIKDKSPLFELIHKSGSGPGYAVKNGKVVDGRQVFASVWDGHADHVHVAAGPKTIVAIGKLAQQMGLRVSENPHFGGVGGGHVSGSYHFRNEAIDVGGDPHKMNQFAARVKRLYGL